MNNLKLSSLFHWNLQKVNNDLNQRFKSIGMLAGKLTSFKFGLTSGEFRNISDEDQEKIIQILTEANKLVSEIEMILQKSRNSVQ